MIRIVFVLALLLSFSAAAVAQPPDPSCAASGEKVTSVQKGGVSINLGCPASILAPNDFVCECRALTKTGGKCRAYPCNSKGDEMPTANTDASPVPDGGMLSGYSNFGAQADEAHNADPKDEFALGLKLMEGADKNNKSPLAGTEIIYDAAGRGYAPAQAAIGVEILLGNVKELLSNDQADQAAFYWFSEAAVQGDPDGAARLGGMYTAGGKYVPKNPREAYFWLTLAVREARDQPNRPVPKPGSPFLSAETMNQMLDDAKKQLTGADIAAVDAIIGDWRPNLPAVLTPVKPGETTLQKQAERVKEMKAQADAQQAYEDDLKKRAQWQQEHPGEIYPADRPPPPTLDELKTRAASAQADLATAQTAWKKQLKDISDRAAKGDPQAEFDLGYIYLRGDASETAPPDGLNIDQVYAGEKRVTPAPGVSLPQDFAKARDWYKKAAEAGNLEAQYNLGQVYRVGRGTPKDAEQAFFWLSVASRAEQPFFTDEAFLKNPGLAPGKADDIRQKAYDWKPSVSAAKSGKKD